MPPELAEIHQTLLIEGMGTLTELQVLFARPELIEHTDAAKRDIEEYRSLPRDQQVAVCTVIRGGLRRLGRFPGDA